MALQSIGFVDFGINLGHLLGVPTNSSILNDASGEAWAFIFQVPKTGNIDRVLFQTGTVTTAQNMAVTLETVGTDGLPSGSNYGSSTGVTWTPSNSDDNVTVELTLGAAASATVGDIVALRGEWSGTAGNLNISYLGASSGTFERFPKVSPDTGSGFSLTTGGIPKVCLRYDDGTYVTPKGCIPPGIISTLNISSTSTPQEVGVWINVPIAATVCGLVGKFRTNGTTQTSTVSLYTTPSGTPSSQRSSSPTHNQLNLFYGADRVIFDGYDISASTDYVVGILQSSTLTVEVYYYDVSNVNYWGGFAGGSGLTWASRNSGGGAFTQNTTRKLFGAVMLSHLHDGASAGGGGGAFPANLSGGIFQ